MFIPNNSCLIKISSGKTDRFGQPLPGQTVKERCSIVRLTRTNEKTPVRADSSASRGNAREVIADAEALLTVTTKAGIDDIITLAGVDYRIIEIHPQYNVQGKLDHYQIKAMAWR